MLDQHMYNEKTSSSLAKSRLAMNKLLTDSQEQNGSQDIYKRQQWKPEGETERWEWLKEQMTWADVFLLPPLSCLWTYLDTLFLRLTGLAMFCLHKGQNRFLLNSFVLREETVLSRSEFCHWIFSDSHICTLSIFHGMYQCLQKCFFSPFTDVGYIFSKPCENSFST